MTLRKSHWVLACLLAILLHSVIGYIIFASPQHRQGAQASGLGGYEVSISMIAAATGPNGSQFLQKKQNAKIVEPEKTETAKPQKTQPSLSDKNMLNKKRLDNPHALNAVKTDGNIRKPQKFKKVANNNQGTKEIAEKANRPDAVTRQGGSSIIGNAKPDYLTELRHWLEKYKTYPKKSKRRKEQGITTVTFTVSRDGVILHSLIQQSSGYERLDEATLEMLKRAQPLPSFPEQLKDNTLQLTLPIQYTLK